MVFVSCSGRCRRLKASACSETVYSFLDKGVLLIQINIGKVCTLYRSAGRCQFAGNQFQQGCFAAAVITFNAEPVAAA